MFVKVKVEPKMENLVWRCRARAVAVVDLGFSGICLLCVAYHGAEIIPIVHAKLFKIMFGLENDYNNLTISFVLYALLFILLVIVSFINALPIWSAGRLFVSTDLKRDNRNIRDSYDLSKYWQNVTIFNILLSVWEIYFVSWRYGLMTVIVRVVFLYFVIPYLVELEDIIQQLSARWNIFEAEENLK